LPGGQPEEIYARAKPVRTPTIGDLEPIYTNPSAFRPLSDASSSSGGGSMPCDYQNVKKNSRFSLDSLQSSATPKTPDYNTAGEEEPIFLYTAPERTISGQTVDGQSEIHMFAAAIRKVS